MPPLPSALGPCLEAPGEATKIPVGARVDGQNTSAGDRQMDAALQEQSPEPGRLWGGETLCSPISSLPCSDVAAKVPPAPACSCLTPPVLRVRERVKPPPAPLGRLRGGCPSLLLAPQSCCGAEAGTSLLLAVPRPRSRTISHHLTMFSAVHSCLLPTKYQVGYFKLMQASFVLGCERSIKPSLSFCFIPISLSVSLEMLATYLLINCTANGQPLSSPPPESEALWERCLPVVSLSTRGFSRLKCFNKLKESYQKLNIWKPKSPGANRQLSAHSADLHSPTHFPLNITAPKSKKRQSLNLEIHQIPAQESNKASISCLPKPEILLSMGNPTQSPHPTQPLSPHHPKALNQHQLTHAST